MEIKISIIMPIYNAEKYLRQAIESVLNQTYVDFELILVNDGSVDESGNICDEYSEKDSRVKVIHKENGGICSARNAGMCAAQGNYIMFMDNDDILTENTLQENYELLINYDADWVKFGKGEILIQGDKKLKQRDTSFKEGIYNNNEIMNKFMMLKKMDVMTFVWDPIFKKDILKTLDITINL